MPSCFVATAKQNVAAKPSGGERNHRRGERRIPHRVPCRVSWHDPHSGQNTSLVGQTVNISSSGLSVQLGYEIPTGTWIETLVPHLDDEPIFVCGTVAHIRRVLTGTFEIGIQFGSRFQPGEC